MIGLPVHEFRPIDLDELLANAALLTRVDRKYVLDRRGLLTALRQFDRATRVLTIGSRRAFAYESVYFDTPDLLSYRLSAYARRRRFKVRTRSYLDSDLSYLEVKVPSDRGATIKERVAYDIGRRHHLTSDGRRYVADVLARRGLDAGLAGDLSPALVTGYERVTLLPPEPGVRVTIDTDLAWHDDSGTTLYLPDLVIVETKSGSGTSAVDRLLWRDGHRPDSISKYGTGLAALRGDLPANKWTRVLHRHFPAKESPCAA